LWAYAKVSEIALHAAADATIAYIHGDRSLAMYSCKICGCTTHWIGLDSDETSKMAVNFRMCEPCDIESVRIRKLDGADTWEFMD